jgi:hypothetical protein
MAVARLFAASFNIDYMHCLPHSGNIVVLNSRRNELAIFHLVILQYYQNPKNTLIILSDEKNNQVKTINSFFCRKPPAIEQDAVFTPASAGLSWGGDEGNRSDFHA